MAFTASDLADWFDEWAEEYWRQQDEWLIDASKHPLLARHEAIAYQRRSDTHQTQNTLRVNGGTLWR